MPIAATRGRRFMDGARWDDDAQVIVDSFPKVSGGVLCAHREACWLNLVYRWRRQRNGLTAAHFEKFSLPFGGAVGEDAELPHPARGSLERQADGAREVQLRQPRPRPRRVDRCCVRGLRRYLQ